MSSGTGRAAQQIPGLKSIRLAGIIAIRYTNAMPQPSNIADTPDEAICPWNVYEAT